ncbi:MAG: plasmid maintenance system killer family protein [Prolixibacteraceae bacterium]|jgi:toxin HigB-1|nr:plasmid maintenance system killer family protein [Prolixibacteraceae bacterium]MBT6004976.1 plasmid maintenance system killer family protein [Prolixibacteraceae bacterium]MBT6765523.1 plasmid maintenance system killer family protein [Prolixibacteraceae bacterium]MBT7000087.1 plasmid maintenance system killer family protein [Prolixibacteraceae bacterium]MBT7395089.1 plasmid maintenance system killer family protein [Prolixibacteraceae bacterium]
MIKSFQSKETEKVWFGKYSTKLPKEIQQFARRKLKMLNNSVNLIDLRIPLSNSLEKLRGNLKKFYNIRINQKWRIIFNWKNGNAFKVKIVDYH